MKFTEEMPELKFDSIGQINWEEVEKWLHYNSSHYNSSHFNKYVHLAWNLKLNHVDMLRLLIFELYKQNQTMINQEIIRLQNNSLRPDLAAPVQTELNSHLRPQDKMDAPVPHPTHTDACQHTGLGS